MFNVNALKGYEGDWFEGFFEIEIITLTMVKILAISGFTRFIPRN